jgi:hypothetical protein
MSGAFVHRHLVPQGVHMPKSFHPEAEHSLVHMRDAKIALQILAPSGDTSQASLCVCCANFGTPACPHRGEEKTGHCEGYRLDESDIARTEGRVHAALCGT